MKNFKNWLNKHTLAISLLSLLILLAIDTFFLVSALHGEIDFLGYFVWPMSIALTIIYVILCVSLIRSKIMKKYLTKIWQELDILYFHGFKIHRYLDSKAFSRLQSWLGCGMCYELSALAMLVLKCNKTAKLYRGDYYDQSGKLQTRHGWVEFRIPFCGWCVADFSWIHEGFARKKNYFRNLDGGRLKARWSCGYKDFWDLPFPNVLHKSMQNKKTSYVLGELTRFSGPYKEEDGFTEWCYSGQDLKYTDGTFMIPFYLEGKPVNSRIMRDFVKNPRRRHPRAKSIRLAELGIRRFRVWRSQQKITN